MVLVANAVTRCPSCVGDLQLRAGVRAFLAHDYPHPRRPGLEIQQAGDVGDPRTLAELAVTVVGWRPTVARYPRQRLREGVGQAELDRVRQPLGDQPVQELLRRAGAVGADQDLAARPGPRLVSGQLRERGLDDRDVVGGSVAASISLAQQAGQRLTSALGAVIDEGPQRVESESAFERRCGLFLVRVRGDPGGVGADDQRAGRRRCRDRARVRRPETRP